MNERFVSWIPLILFALFAAFWSFWCVHAGLWRGLVPSGLVFCLLLALPDRDRPGRSS